MYLINTKTSILQRYSQFEFRNQIELKSSIVDLFQTNSLHQLLAPNQTKADSTYIFGSIYLQFLYNISCLYCYISKNIYIICIIKDKHHFSSTTIFDYILMHLMLKKLIQRKEILN